MFGTCGDKHDHEQGNVFTICRCLLVDVILFSYSVLEEILNRLQYHGYPIHFINSLRSNPPCSRHEPATRRGASPSRWLVLGYHPALTNASLNAVLTAFTGDPVWRNVWRPAMGRACPDPSLGSRGQTAAAPAGTRRSTHRRAQIGWMDGRGGGARVTRTPRIVQAGTGGEGQPTGSTC